MIIDQLLVAADSIQMRDRLRNRCGFQRFAVAVEKGKALGVEDVFGRDKKVEGDPSSGIAGGHGGVHGEGAAGSAGPSGARQKQGDKG
jgi:hypothetical protein